MHVAINALFWNSLHTGSGQYLRGLVSGLRKIDASIKITLIFPPNSPVQEDVPDGVNVFKAKGLGGQIGKVWFEQCTFPWIAGKLGVDIAHIPYWATPLSSPVPMVTSVFDVIPLAIADYRRSPASKMYVSLVKASAKKSSQTITISNASKADIIKYLGLDAETITPIYLAVADSYTPQTDAVRDMEVKRKYDLPDRFVLYMGGFDSRKNVDQLLLAYSQIILNGNKFIPLVIAGHAPKWGKGIFKNLRDFSKRFADESSVRRIGYVDEADKPSIYRLARVFVYPSIYEGFGIPLVEAMACGCPVIATNRTSIPEVLSDAGVYFDATSVDDLAATLMSICNDDARLEVLRQKGLRRAEFFNWEKTAKETLNVYQRALNFAHLSSDAMIGTD